MKRFISISLAAIASFVTISLGSCKVDKCKAIVCANDGACEEDGSCTCPVGYEGERCETLSRERFIGAWIVDEDGTVSNVARYTVSVENGPQINQVQIRNFNNQSNAVVVGTIHKDTITIATQSFQVGTLTKTVIGYRVAEPEGFDGAHGKVRFYYSISSSDGVTDNFGYRESGTPSIWVK